MPSASFSASQRVRAHVALQLFALQGVLPERLPEEVLALIAASVATVARDGQHQLAFVFVVAAEYFLEPLREVHELGLVHGLPLKEGRFHQTQIHAAVAIVSAVEG